MEPIAVATTIKAPIAEVWRRLENLESHQEWMGDVGSLSFVGDQRHGLGTRLQVETRVGPMRVTDEMVVTVWDPPHRMRIEHLGIVKGTGEFILSPIGGATRFTWIEDLRFPWRLGGAFTAIASRPILASIWRRNLSRFKELVLG